MATPGKPFSRSSRFGQSSGLATITAVSVDPKPSHTVHPNRRPNSVDVAVGGLVAEGDA